MAHIDHIRRCNRRNMTRFRPFVVEAGAQVVGWVRHDVATGLGGLHPSLNVRDDAVILGGPDTVQARTDAMAAVVDALVARGDLPRLRHEAFAVKAAWSAPDVLRLDRGAVAIFGVRAWGLHVNGWLRRPDGSLHLWVGRRALDKSVAPGKLDNLVAGGQPAGLSLHDNLLKESAEEADIPAALAARAVPVGTVSYCFENDTGLKPDTLFCYDLEIPQDFVPANTDGELTGFELWPVERVLETVRDTEDFKFNVNLVILDFALRHGLLRPDDEPDYEALATGLRAVLP